MRPTYRYTPLLAWILQPNIWLSDIFGKVLFVVFDIVAGYLIHNILNRQGVSHGKSVFCASLWVINPLSATVSTRGNAESVMAFLVLLTLKFLLEDRIIPAAMAYALSIHFKIYPVTYALPIYFALNEGLVRGQARKNGIGRLFQWIWPTKKQLKFFTMTAVISVLMTGIYYKW